MAFLKSQRIFLIAVISLLSINWCFANTDSHGGGDNQPHDSGAAQNTTSPPRQANTTEFHPCEFHPKHRSHNTHHGAHGEHEEHEERYHVAVVDFHHVHIPLVISIVIIVASVAKIGFHMNHKMSSIFPESCLLIIIGVIVGIILYFSPIQGYEMDSTTFFLYLLPPIMLEAGYFMPAREFFDNVGTVLTMAVIGTIFNAMLIGFTIYGLSETVAVGTGEIDMLHCLVFSTLLSAVDPVAVLAVFDEVHVNPNLHIVVFGESLLNDGVTVVMYHMFENFSEIGMENIITQDIIFGLVSFVVVAVGGTLIGTVFGFITALMTKFTHQVRVVEPVLVFTMGYCSYIMAELFHLSGILSCVACGMSMKKYVEKNISQKSHTTIKYFIKMMASVSETIIFMYLGTSTVSEYHHWESGFVLLTLISCIIYRTIVVIFLVFIANKFRLVRLSAVDQFIMSYGGLRGAIAFSLVVLLDPVTFPNRKLFITTAVVVVYFTVFIQGATIKPLVKVLRVKKADKRKPTMGEKINNRLVDHVMAGMEDIIGPGCRGHHGLRHWFERIDNKYIKPLLVREKDKVSRGRSFVNVHQKISEKEAHDHVKRRGSFMTLEHSLKAYDMQRSSSFSHLFAAGLPGMPPRDSNGLGPGRLGLPQTPSDISLDRRSNEGSHEPPAIHRSDTSMRHLLDENFIEGSKKKVTHNRHMLEEEPSKNKKPLDHQERLRLRKMLSPKKKPKPGNLDYRRTSIHLNLPGMAGAKQLKGQSFAKKNVSFVNQAPITEEEIKSTDNESNHSDNNSDDGINFSVNKGQKQTTNHVTAAETTLPWKQNNDEPPLSSQRHSSRDSHDEESTGSELESSENNSGDDTNTQPDPLYSVVSKRLEQPVAHSVKVPGDNYNSSSDNNNSDKALDYNNKVAAASSSEDVDDTDTELPLPWKREPQREPMSYSPKPFQESSDSFHLKPLEPVQNGTESLQEEVSIDLQDLPIPPPWRENSDSEPVQSSPDPETAYVHYPDSPIKTEVELDSVHSDTGAVVSVGGWNIGGGDSEVSLIPPPWRQLSDSSQGGLRTGAADSEEWTAQPGDSIPGTGDESQYGRGPARDEQSTKM